MLALLGLFLIGAVFVMTFTFRSAASVKFSVRDFAIAFTLNFGLFIAGMVYVIIQGTAWYNFVPMICFGLIFCWHIFVIDLVAGNER